MRIGIFFFTRERVINLNLEKKDKKDEWFGILKFDKVWKY